MAPLPGPRLDWLAIPNGGARVYMELAAKKYAPYLYVLSYRREYEG